MKEFVINEKNEGQRLDKFLNRTMPNAGMSFLYKMLRKKNITLNGKKAKGSESLLAGDTIRIFFTDDTFEKFAKKKGQDNLYENLKSIETSQLDIIFENEDFIVVNKPFGVLSQKADNVENSVNEMIISHLIKGGLSKEDFAAFKPGVLNRLDRNTGGLIISAKNRKAAVHITEDIKTKRIRRIYNCIVHGKFDREGIISGYYTKNTENNLVLITPDKRSGALEVSCAFKLLDYNNDLSLVECELLTGKSHQIRATMQMLGFPLVGDSKYGNRDADKTIKLCLPGQYLFAKKLIFPDKTEVCTELPLAFKEILQG